MEDTIKYEPTEQDVVNVDLIKNFLNDTEIPYINNADEFGVFHLNDGKIQVRYVNSFYHKMDNSKRFGDKCKGIKHDYFINISHGNIDNDIRTIWVFDFEMSQTNEAVINGVKILDYHRQWEVIKNTIRTACGKIKYRFYARDCEVKLVDNATLRQFLDTNCFYGYRSANKNLGLYLKKDKNGFKKGTLLMVYTFGYNFYGNKARPDDPFIEIIRVSTVNECQVIGGASKSLKHFFMDYPTLHIGERDVNVREVKFYVDASHNDGRAMTAMKFKFVSWTGAGFMNLWTEDFNDGKLKGKKGEIFHRKPMFHKRIMELIGEGKIISVANAGTIVYSITKDEFLEESVLN